LLSTNTVNPKCWGHTHVMRVLQITVAKYLVTTGIPTLTDAVLVLSLVSKSVNFLFTQQKKRIAGYFTFLIIMKPVITFTS
jgi:hypothetical protein